jgi:hypothetical protein
VELDEKGQGETRLKIETLHGDGAPRAIEVGDERHDLRLHTLLRAPTTHLRVRLVRRHEGEEHQEDAGRLQELGKPCQCQTQRDDEQRIHRDVVAGGGDPGLGGEDDAEPSRCECADREDVDLPPHGGHDDHEHHRGDHEVTGVEWHRLVRPVVQHSQPARDPATARLGAVDDVAATADAYHLDRHVYEGKSNDGAEHDQRTSPLPAHTPPTGKLRTTGVEGRG